MTPFDIRIRKGCASVISASTPSSRCSLPPAAAPKFLSIFNVERDGWQLLPGEYQVLVGGSSRETPLAAALRVP